jgi:radical SAM protein with 4Fe4S-binding SPASM domain
MSNLSITMRCNNNCGYCFAKDARQSGAGTEMSRETFIVGMEYLKRSGIDQIRLLGGEPTLHTDIIWMLEQAQQYQFKILLFSNGLISEGILDNLVSMKPDQLQVLLNTSNPDEAEGKIVLQQQETMKRLGKMCMLGVNIERRGQSLEYLLKFTQEFDLKPEVRLGIAHPALSKQNSFLHTKFYSAVGQQIVAFHSLAKEQGIELRLDCGFVPCMFPLESDSDIGNLLEQTVNSCQPNLDLLPDGNFISCYPLNNLMKLRLTIESTATSLQNSFSTKISTLEKIGIYPSCSKCHLFGDRCVGGCAAQKMQRLDNNANN